MEVEETNLLAFSDIASIIFFSLKGFNWILTLKV